MAVKLPVVINEWIVCFVGYEVKQPTTGTSTPMCCLAASFLLLLLVDRAPSGCPVSLKATLGSPLNPALSQV